VVLTLAAGSRHSPGADANYWIWLTAVCTVSLLAVVLAGVRRRREERLARMTAIAKASQVALLPPLLPEITGISIAARYRSATPEASVGGDLYEIIPTGYGIRVIIGDVRGRGLDAILLARHVLSAFRRSAVAVPALEHVAGEVSRAIRPHLGEEDFVTAVLAQIAPSGELTVVNCGHHPPLLHHGQPCRVRLHRLQVGGKLGADVGDQVTGLRQPGGQPGQDGVVTGHRFQRLAGRPEQPHGVRQVVGAAGRIAEQRVVRRARRAVQGVRVGQPVFLGAQLGVLAVGLTLGVVVLLVLLAGNVYQFLHYRGQTTIATVNGAPITQSQFDQAAGSSDQALQSLIDQQLILQEAKKEKVSVPDSEVNSEVSTIRQQLGSPSEFTAALQRANLSEAQLREQIRTQKLATEMGAQGVTVSNDEAQTYYNQNKPQFGTQTFDQAKDQISGQLLQSKQNEAIQTWIAGLRQKAKISIHIPA